MSEEQLCPDCGGEHDIENPLETFLGNLINQVPPEEPVNIARDRCRRIAKLMIRNIQASNISGAERVYDVLRPHMVTSPWSLAIWEEIHITLCRTSLSSFHRLSNKIQEHILEVY